MKRYTKIVFEAENGIIFDGSEGTSGELIIKAMIASNNVCSELPTVSAGEYAEGLSVYTDKDGNKAVVPQGWTVSGIPKENIIWGKDKGLVIYHIPKKEVRGINWQNQDEVEALMRTYDQFVWTPVGLLTANGTLNGIYFNEKFGRMNYENDYENYDFSEFEYHEPLVGELLLQKESVNKNDGYYISRYNISKDKKTGRPRSVKGTYPWTNINFTTAKEVAGTMVENENIKSHLTFGAEYDTLVKWMIETGTVTTKEVTEDSTELGNYYHSRKNAGRIVETGKDGCLNNVYGLAGNVCEWTQEQWNSSERVVRGGYFDKFSSYSLPVNYRWSKYPDSEEDEIGFRGVLYIKLYGQL